MPADSELVGRVTSAVLVDLEAIADALSAEHPSAPATTFAFGGGRAAEPGAGSAAESGGDCFTELDWVDAAVGTGLAHELQRCLVGCQ